MCNWKSPKRRLEWEERMYKWMIFQQTMFDFQRVPASGVQGDVDHINRERWVMLCRDLPCFTSFPCILGPRQPIHRKSLALRSGSQHAAQAAPPWTLPRSPTEMAPTIKSWPFWRVQSFGPNGDSVIFWQITSVNMVVSGAWLAIGCMVYSMMGLYTNFEVVGPFLCVVGWCLHEFLYCKGLPHALAQLLY